MKKIKLFRSYAALERVARKIELGELLTSRDVSLLCANSYLRYGNTQGVKIQFLKRIEDFVFLLKYSRKLYNPSLHALIRVLEKNGFVEDTKNWIRSDKNMLCGANAFDLIYNGGISGFCLEYISDDELHLVSEIQSFLLRKVAQKNAGRLTLPQACAQWEDGPVQSIENPE